MSSLPVALHNDMSLSSFLHVDSFLFPFSFLSLSFLSFLFLSFLFPFDVIISSFTRERELSHTEGSSSPSLLRMSSTRPVVILTGATRGIGRASRSKPIVSQRQYQKVTFQSSSARVSIYGEVNQNCIPIGTVRAGAIAVKRDGITLQHLGVGDSPQRD